jgi:hypothetical protein
LTPRRVGPWRLYPVRPTTSTTTSLHRTKIMHSLTYVYGATRILGGGVFELTYSPSVDLLRQANFRRLTASASNGEGAYIERGTLIYAYSPRRTNAVPEPSTWAMMLLGFTSLGFAGYRRARKSPESAAVAPTPPSCPLRRWVSDLREVVGGTAFAPRPQRNGRRRDAAALSILGSIWGKDGGTGR